MNDNTEITHAILMIVAWSVFVGFVLGVAAASLYWTMVPA